MAYLYGLIVVGLFFGVMHFFTELKASQKITATLVILVVVLGAIGFNINQTSKAEKVRQVMLAFNQGKTVVCQGVDVNKSDFSLSVGTQTFIALKMSPHAGKMIAARGCE